MKTIIIGQAPSMEHGDYEALSGKSGQRLAALAGLTLPEFLDRFERLNLLDRFPGKAGRGDLFVGPGEARRLAEKLRPVLRGRRVVLLGFSVAGAFGVTHPAMVFAPHWNGLFAFCPHPSGVNRWWNDAGNLRRAAVFWHELAAAPDL